MALDPKVLGQFKLTPDEQSILDNNTTKIKTLREVVRRMKTAGIDVSQEEAELDRAEKVNNGLRKQFGASGRP